MLALPFLLFALLSGCISPSMILVNREGKVIRCAFTGYGYGIAGAIAMSAAQTAYESCVEDARLLGFYPLSKAHWGIIPKDRTSSPVVISSVQPGSSAALSGLRPGDIVRSIDGVPIEIAGDMIPVFSKKAPGDLLSATIERDGQTFEVQSILGQR